MQAGDIVRVDFGVPLGSEPGFERPAVVVTTNVIRRLPSEVAITADGLVVDSSAQCHLSTTISIARVMDGSNTALGNIGPASLAQLRSVLADLLDIP
jgi:mRNA-degrading endonuclease toxin of MazEF toxin-antitoxin module